ncbi:sporulation protein YabP [Clostridium sp. chh4-2]|uniref:sporulation protein YabP n=1 Tax=Clostridium sp. chh4-2 TaxID=2067550 RepID=UPI000CCF6E7B|nr:sporulation protein YabP [Clostridium sp. chh4-2]PNV62426.1 sporulation protein YabP [Clostridium sp. chh4-2]
MQEKMDIRPHKVIMENRSSSSITGIRDVVSFNENQVVLDTDMGLLTIKGKDLHVSRLTVEKGEADVDGTIDSLVYTSNEAFHKSAESWVVRLFK